MAGFVNGLSGTGYALVALGFWLQAMSPITAAPLVALCSVGGHVQSLPAIWRGVRWPRLWPFLAAGLLGVPLGTLLLEHVRVQPLKLGVGLLLIFYCAWMGFVRRPPIVSGGGRLADAAIGFAGGVHGRHGEPQRPGADDLGAAARLEQATSSAASTSPSTWPCSPWRSSPPPSRASSTARSSSGRSSPCRRP